MLIFSFTRTMFWSYCWHGSMGITCRYAASHWLLIQPFYCWKKKAAPSTDTGDFWQERRWIKHSHTFALTKYFWPKKTVVLQACVLQLNCIFNASDFWGRKRTHLGSAHPAWLCWSIQQNTIEIRRTHKTKKVPFKWNRHPFQAAIYLQPFVSQHSI